MSTALEAASLIMIPTSYSDGLLASAKPNDGAGDFTFTRGSNLSATRVNADGYIEKGYENLLLQSNSFDTNPPWGNTSISFASGQSGYDGSSDAWIIERVGVNGHIRQTPPLGNVSTFSIYVKANTLNWVRIRTDSVQNAYFNLDPTFIGNRIGYTQNVIDATITDIGNGWFRCTATAIGYDRFLVYPAVDNQDTSGTSGSIYIQDAMINQGMVAHPYIETTTAPVAAGILEDTPRIDFSGGNQSLLLEPSRTNEFSHSEYLGEPNSQAYNVTIAANAAISPEGLNNAYSLISNTGANEHFLGMYWYGAASGGTETFSVYAKANGYDWLYLRTNTGSWSTAHANFNLATGEKGLIGSGLNSSSIVDMGNGWYRCSITYSNRAVSARLQITSRPSEGASSVFTADGTSGAYIYGAQLEEASYPTSYIPTYGVSQTRLGEGASYSGFSSLIGQTEGTLFLDIENSSDGTEIFSLNRSIVNSIFLLGSGGVYRAFIYADGTTISQVTSINVSDRIKIAIAYQSNNWAIYANGLQVYTNNTQTWTPNVAIDLINFNTGGYAASKGAVRYNQVSIIPIALSDEACIELTTI